MRLGSLHRAYPSLHPFGVVHWVPEQLNIKAVTGACKLIDGCSLALCSATVSVVSTGICHRNEVNSIAWLYRRAQPKDSIIYITLHYSVSISTDLLVLHISKFKTYHCHSRRASLPNRRRIDIKVVPHCKVGAVPEYSMKLCRPLAQSSVDKVSSQFLVVMTSLFRGFDSKHSPIGPLLYQAPESGTHSLFEIRQSREYLLFVKK